MPSHLQLETDLAGVLLMTQNEEPNGEVRTGPATYLVEAVVAFIVLIIG